MGIVSGLLNLSPPELLQRAFDVWEIAKSVPCEATSFGQYAGRKVFVLSFYFLLCHDIEFIFCFK